MSRAKKSRPFGMVKNSGIGRSPGDQKKDPPPAERINHFIIQHVMKHLESNAFYQPAAPMQLTYELDDETSINRTYRGIPRGESAATQILAAIIQSRSSGQFGFSDTEIQMMVRQTVVMTNALFVELAKVRNVDMDKIKDAMGTVRMQVIADGKARLEILGNQPPAAEAPSESEDAPVQPAEERAADQG